MRILAKSIIGILLFGIMTVTVNKALQTSSKVAKNKSLLKTSAKKLPFFEFHTLDSVPFSKYDLEKDKSLVLVHFDPDCGLCKKSGEIFYSFKRFHEASQVLFVSHSSVDKIVDYRERFNLSSIANLTFLRCNEDDFFTLFKELSAPTYFIYNTRQELIKKINDDVPVKTLLRYIKAAQIDQ